MEDDVDISALTIDQYITLIPDDIKPGPKIGYDEDTYEHVRTVLEIMDLFHFPSVTHDAIMLKGEKVKAITKMGKENMKESVPHDLPPTPFLGHLKEQIGSPYRTRETVHMIGNPEEIHNEKAHEDKGDMDVVVPPCIPLGLVHDKDKIVREKEQDYDIPLNDSVMQPLAPQMIHITQPDDDYVAPATNPMSNKQSNKFEEEFSHITEILRIKNPEEIHNEEAQEDEGDMDIRWDITSKDIERLRQFLTPTIHTLPNLKPVVPPCIPLGLVQDKDKIIREKEQDYDIPLNDSIMQTLTPQTIHITQPDDDYVALASKSYVKQAIKQIEEEFSILQRSRTYGHVRIKRLLDDLRVTVVKKTIGSRSLHCGLPSKGSAYAQTRVSMSFGGVETSMASLTVEEQGKKEWYEINTFNRLQKASFQSSLEIHGEKYLHRRYDLGSSSSLSPVWNTILLWEEQAGI
ncbi:hypothetical protein Tco_0180470 [Tanacetum coccineum]